MKATIYKNTKAIKMISVIVNNKKHCSYKFSKHTPIVSKVEVVIAWWSKLTKKKVQLVLSEQGWSIILMFFCYQVTQRRLIVSGKLCNEVPGAYLLKCVYTCL